MPPTDDEDDPSFLELSARLRRRIDDAFDSVASFGAPLRQSKFEVPAGGFIVEESEAGGFIVEGDSPSDAKLIIPLSEIPRALKHLDLFPDDEIMAVFKNAATGWGAQDMGRDGVSRKDWRAVCAALLDGEQEGDVQMVGDGGADSDEYETEEPSGGTEEPSSDEYEGPSRTAARTGKARRGTPTNRLLSETQKAQCRRDFSRFFPHVPDSELDRQRITIKDITHVAGLLKENLKAEEILDMLEAFSTSPDKSMSLADFEHMMTVTKLV